MGTKYSSTLPTGYNSNPPADDGSQVASNKVKYSTIKSKLADPLNDFASALDTALQAAFDTSSSIVSVDYTTVASDHLKPIECSGTITISLGDAATMESGYRAIVANVSTGIITVGVATNTDTLNGTADGTITLRPNDCATFTVNQGADGYEIVSAFIATPSVTAISADKTVAASDFPGVFNCTSDVTISLDDPAGVTQNLPLTIINSSTGVLTVSPLTGDTIDGVSANYTVPVGSRITLISTGAAWIITQGAQHAGSVLQMVTGTDTGSSTTSTTSTAMTNTNVSITPKSTKSKLLIEISGLLETVAAAGVTTQGTIDISEGTTAITNDHFIGVSTAGENINAPYTMRVIKTNAALTARNFGMVGFVTSGGTLRILNQVITITEIAT